MNFSELSSLHLTNDIIKFEFDENLKSSLKRFLVEMKVQVDRWDLVTDNFVFHHNVEFVVKELLSDDLWYKDKHKLWGADLTFTDQIAGDHVFGFSSTKSVEDVGNRHIVMGILPSNNIQKYYDLRAFW